MSKKRSETKESPTAAQPSPVFRPLEAQLKKLAEQKRAEEKKTDQSKVADKGKRALPTARPKAAPDAVTHTRSNLTRDERRDLEAMEKAQGRDDEFFFARLMSGVRPLDDDKRGRVTSGSETKGQAAKPATSTPMPAPRNTDDEVRDHLLTLVEGATRFEVNDDGQRLSGRRIDLDAGTFRRVRRGELPIDARIDLHGQRADEARQSLEVFLREKRARRERLVLVIHGRGEHSPAGIGVLRGEISAWLSQGRASQHVAAYATAREEDGGEGAIYVLLRS